MFKAFNSWKVVLLSIIGATTFWFFNALNKDYDARTSYPIDFQFESDSVVVMVPLPTSLSIDVSGGGWNLLRRTFWLTVSPIQIVLENPTEIGFYTRNSLLPLVTSQLSELKINALLTDTLYINIERKRSKKVAVRVDSTAIDLAENHRITSAILAYPDSITLIGPQSFYDTLSNFATVNIPVKGISSDFDRDMGVLVTKDPRVSSNPNNVRVTFAAEKFLRKSIDITVETENFPLDSSAILADNTVQVFYTIAQSRQDNFNNGDFAITADFKLMRKKDSTVMVIMLLYPEDAMEIDVIPENLKVINGRR
ncbi:MAG: hypothetical protein ACI83W_002120 [Marinoscillum sp.]